MAIPNPPETTLTRMTDMELDVFEKASVHYEGKNNKRDACLSLRSKNALKFLKRDHIVIEFWEDYFSGKPIYTITKGYVTISVGMTGIY
tara:strand:- start:178 stop:444 length:267 start_codon:yes stop_codon:yes gene_type:complete